VASISLVRIATVGAELSARIIELDLVVPGSRLLSQSDQPRFRTRDVDLASQALWTAEQGVTSLLILRPDFRWAKKKDLVATVVDSAVDGLVCTSPRRRSV
jgi:hypothetical protein